MSETSITTRSPGRQTNLTTHLQIDTMVHVIITNAKQSERFPGKNEILLDYTLDYVAREAPLSYNIWMVLRENDENHQGCINFGSNHVLYAPRDEKYDDHLTLMRWITEYINDPDGKYILLQLTQPVRRSGLLQDAVHNISEDNIVLSYTSWTDDSWRMVDDGTLDNINMRDDEMLHKFMDGSLYGWMGSPDKIFSPTKQRKVWISNGIAPVTDIDRPWQYDRQYIDGVGQLLNSNEKRILR